MSKPILLLTGFLGSGKTTFLNAFLQHNNTTRFAVIENEIGDIGIDGDLIIQSKEKLVTMNNGCICCTLNDNFLTILKSLMDTASEWDELIIEATGIADPSAIITPLLQYPVLKAFFSPLKIICLVDAKHVFEQLTHTKEAAKQLAYCDLVLINKTDNCKPESLQELRDKIKVYNPLAKVFYGNKTNYPIDEILAYQKPKQLQLSISAPQNFAQPVVYSSLKATSFRYFHSFDYETLHQRLFSFSMLQSENIYRYKGIVYDKNRKNRIIVQSVMNTLVLEDGDPWQENETLESRFVFIGKDIESQGIDRMLQQCFSK